MTSGPDMSLEAAFAGKMTAKQALDDAEDLAHRVKRRLPRGRVLGPAPAFFARLKDEHRFQFFLKGTARHAMRQALLEALAGTGGAARLS